MKVHYSIELWTLNYLIYFNQHIIGIGSLTCPLESDFVREKWCLSYINDILSNIHIILQENDVSPLLYRAMDSDLLNKLQLTYYWYWITHMSTRIGLHTRKVLLEID